MDFYFDKIKLRSVEMFNSSELTKVNALAKPNTDIQILEATNLMNGKMLEKLTGKPTIAPRRWAIPKN